MLVVRLSACSVLLFFVLSLQAVEPVVPKPPPSGAPWTRLGQGTLVPYPVPDQQDVPTTSPGGEYPDPIPKSNKKQAGFPITATFGAKMGVTGAKGKLLDEQNKEVPAWFSSPQDPANDKYKPHQQNSLCLIPMSPLKPGSTYTVQMEGPVDKAHWANTWKITTAADVDPIEDIKVVMARLNQLRDAAGLGPVELDAELSRVCQAHARYLARNLPDQPDLKVREE